MHVTQKQYERILGLAKRGSAAAQVDPGHVCQVLNAAARVARSGRLQEAETMISSLPIEGPLAPAILDLKARICAQQGRLVEAQLCWMEAVRQSPGNESYRRSLQHATRVLCASRLRLVICVALMVALAIIAFALAGMVGKL